MAACARCNKNRTSRSSATEPAPAGEVNLDDCYNLLISLMPCAATLAMEGFNKVNKQTESKRGDWDLVTIYDRAIENLFIESIKKIYPEHVFLGEETSGELILTDAPTWIIDPIDGTLNFVHGLSLFAINVAFSLGKELQFGVTYNPALELMYTARKGEGAFLNGEPIKCSDAEALGQALCLLDPLFQTAGPIRDNCFKSVYKFGATCRGVRLVGCAAMQLAYIASGAADVYMTDHLKPWDLAAGAILVQEAGGYVAAVDGSPYSLLSGSIAAGSTTELCRQAIQLYRESHETPLELN